MGNQNYYRSFVIFKPKDKNFGAFGGKDPAGYCKIEVKKNQGKLEIYVQDMKSAEALGGIYDIVMASSNRGINALRITSVEVGSDGKGKCVLDFDPASIQGSGNSLSSYNALAVVYRPKDGNSGFKYPLVGYSGKNVEIDWSTLLKQKGANGKEETRLKEIQTDKLTETTEALADEIPAAETELIEISANEAPAAQTPLFEIPAIEVSADEIEEHGISTDAIYELETSSDEICGLETSSDEIHELETSSDSLRETEASADDIPAAEAYADEIPDIGLPNTYGHRDIIESEQPSLDEYDMPFPDKELSEDLSAFPFSENEIDGIQDKKIHAESVYDDQKRRPFENHDSIEDNEPVYWDRVKDYYTRLFKGHKKICPFNDPVGEVEWIRVEHLSEEPYPYMAGPVYGYRANESYLDHYLIGLVRENGKVRYVAYAVPGLYSAVPPMSMHGFSRWLPLKNGYGSGYWLLYIDSETGNIAYPY